MSISSKAISLTLHRIFSEQRVGSGCTLSLKSMMNAWSATGLRMHDLADGLQELMLVGQLQLEVGEEGPCVRLLDESFAFTNLKSADRATLLATHSMLTQRKRPTHLGNLLGHGEGRRAGDRLVPTRAA